MGLNPGSRLGPYEILSPLGAGGMGEVYRARDTRLGRDVAIKVLPQHLSESPELQQRFEREAKAVAALSHPNILAIHDFGSLDGVSYAVMELLKGQTLRDRLSGGPVSQTQAVDWALQIARGLSAAHEKGIVHRDLKPENLFVMKDGHVKILDFGLAKRVAVANPEEAPYATTLPAPTESGTILGTVGYMSPEQVRGTSVDARSDIFSFGAILYEMLSGERAFRGDSAADTMSAILKEEPPELSESGRNISPALDRIVRHCLEKERERRFQSARDVEFALGQMPPPMVTSGAQPTAPTAAGRRILIAFLVAVALAVAIFILLRRPHHEEGTPAAGVKRMAVLPFENLGSAEDDYFADGIADAVRGKLTSLPGIEVIARASSMSYKKTAKTPRQIAQELEARYLLTATVRWQKAGGASRVQVSPELVEVKTPGAPVSKWQQPFDAQLTDVFQVQSDIATRVTEKLGVLLGTSDQKRLSEKPTQNLAAYDAFLKGEAAADSLGANEAPTLRKALGFYEQAVALDPGFAQAWAKVSRASSLLYAFSVPTPDLAERARQAAEKAVALAPDRPDGYWALGLYHEEVDEYSRALEDFARGRRVAPADTDLLRETAIVERALGRWDAALEHFRQAERLDPLAVRNLIFLGGTLFRLRRYPEARETFDRGLEFAPANLALIAGKAMTFLGEGDLAGARAVLKAAAMEVEPTALVAYLASFWGLVWVLDEGQRELLLRLMPTAFDDDRGSWALCLAQASALKGDAVSVRTYAAEAKKAIEEQLREASENARLHGELGLALAYLGQKADAIREGERAVALRPIAKDAEGGPAIQYQLARIYVLVGEPEKALDQLEPLLKIPSLLSPGWLKIDPTFDPLRKNPRFQRLVAAAKS